MSSWDRICCAVDASEGSRAALQHAVELTTDGGGTLHVLHVVPTGRRGQAAPFAPPPRPAREDTTPARELVRWIAAARERLPGLVVAVERDADVAAGIVAYARESECDVLVLGTRGRRGLGRLVLGSVAEKVVRDAPCPVLIVPVSELRDDVKASWGPAEPVEPQAP